MFSERKISVEKRDREIHRILVNSGLYTLVDYDLSDNDTEEKFFEMTRKYMEMLELDKYFELLKAKFVLDPPIGADATLGRHLIDSKYLWGYSISVHRKI